MPRRTRIEFDQDGSTVAQMLNLLAEYLRAVRDGNQVHAARQAHRVEHLASRLTNSTLPRARDQAGSARKLAEQMGVAHTVIAYRLRAAGADTNEEDTA